MVAMLAFGGTFAYFTATSNKAEESVTTATIKLKANSVATIETLAVSGTEIVTSPVTVSLNNETNTDTWVLVEFDIVVKNAASQVVDSSKDKTGVADEESELGAEEFALVYTMADLGTTGTDGKWAKIGKTTTGSTLYGIKVTYTPADGRLSEIPAVCSKVTFIAKTNSDVNANGEYSDGTLMGATVNFSLTSKAIQVVGNANLAAAAASLGYTMAQA